jgi:putative copper export protein
MHATLLASSVPALSSGLDGFRLIIHVLAATIWVGGQITVAGLLPTIRTLGDGATKAVARSLAACCGRRTAFCSSPASGTSARWTPSTRRLPGTPYWA